MQNPLGVPVVGSAHCGNEALLYSLAAFCGYLVDVYLATFFGGALGKKNGAHHYFFGCASLLFFGVLGYFFSHRKTSLNGLRKHEWAAILRPKNCCIAHFLGATSSFF